MSILEEEDEIKFPAENPFIQIYSKYEHMYSILLLKTFFLNNLREIDCRHKVLNLKNTTILPLSCGLLDGSFNVLIALKKCSVYPDRNYFLDLQPCAKKLAAKNIIHTPKHSYRLL